MVDLPDEPLEREYSPSTAAKDFAGSIAAYRARSDEALHALAWSQFRYGSGADEFVMIAGDPNGVRHIHLFIHGGYWQELSWRDSLFPAPGLSARGITYGAINYTLAPHATLDAIVDQCRRAIAAIVLASDGASRLTLSGSSAGAHLAAMMAQSDWTALGLARNPISALILLSGIYRLEPLLHTSINDALGLDTATANRLSPMLLPVPANSSAVIAWGEQETRAFKQQSAEFADLWRGSGNRVSTLECAGRDHFNVVFDLSDPATPLGRLTGDYLKDDLSSHE